MPLSLIIQIISNLFFPVNTFKSWYGLKVSFRKVQCDRRVGRFKGGRVIVMYLTFEIERKGDIHARAHLIVWCHSFTKYLLGTYWCQVLFLVQWDMDDVLRQRSLVQR